MISDEPSPAIQSGPGQVVTATFVHSTAQVLDLVLQPVGASTANAELIRSSSYQTPGSDELSIGVTSLHPFWSETRSAFIPAGEMQLGEEVVTLEGQLWRLTSISPRDGPEKVYNFEVSGEHVYYVSSQGILVHNSYPDDAAGKASNTNKPGLADGSKPSKANQGPETVRIRYYTNRIGRLGIEASGQWYRRRHHSNAAKRENPPIAIAILGARSEAEDLAIPIRCSPHRRGLLQ